MRFDPDTGRYPSFLIFYSGSPNFIVFQGFFVWPFLSLWLKTRGSGLTDISFMGFHMASCFILGCFPPWKTGEFATGKSTRFFFVPTAPKESSQVQLQSGSMPKLITL